MMTLPLPPRGFSASLVQPWKLSHLPPFYISPHTQFVPFQNALGSYICCQSLFTILWFLPAAREKKIHEPMYLMRCAWHIMLHLNVQLSSPRPSFPKRSEVCAKSSHSRNPNPVKKVPLGPVSSFSTGNLRGCCGANSPLWQEFCISSFNFISSPWEVKS